MPHERDHHHHRSSGRVRTLSHEIQGCLGAADAQSDALVRRRSSPLVHARGHHDHGDSVRHYDPQALPHRRTNSDTKRAHRAHERERHKNDSKPRSGASSTGQATAAAVTAGAAQALKARNEPDKALHVATAAAASAAVDAIIGEKRDAHSVRHVSESTVVGLAIDRLRNGSSKHK